MRIITCAVKSAQTQWLPVLSNIMSSYLWRNESLARTIQNCKEKKLTIVPNITWSPIIYSNQGNPHVTAENLISSNFCGFATWKKEWAKSEVRNQELVANHCKMLEGMYILYTKTYVVNSESYQNRATFLDLTVCGHFSFYQTGEAKLELWGLDLGTL